MSTDLPITPRIYVLIPNRYNTLPICETVAKKKEKRKKGSIMFNALSRITVYTFSTLITLPDDTLPL